MNVELPYLAAPEREAEVADPAEPLISLRDIIKSYWRGPLEVRVLHGVSLDIQAGEFVAIMGMSGSGKTTLMNILGLLDRPSGGSYRFSGQEVADLDADGRALLRRDGFGFVFQQYNLLSSVDAVGNVEVPAIYAGLSRSRRRERARELLGRLGLGDRLDHRPSELSGGQQQRVAIARALMNGGSVILADEPTGALDSRSGEEVMRLLRELNDQGHTILLITHEARVAEKADRIVEIRDGVIVSDVARRDRRGGGAARPVRGARTSAVTDLFEATRMALQAMRVNLPRTLLTLLGIIIGVASVVAMLAIGEGASKAVLDRISSMGTNLLLVRPGAPNIRVAGGQTATLVPADAEAIADLDNVDAAVPELGGQVTVRFGNRDYVTSATATSPTFPIARDWPIAAGSFFGDAEATAYAPVAVLGETVARALFGDADDPLGRYILVNNIPFQVMGVMGVRGASPGGSDYDDVVFVPLSTGSLRLFGMRNIRTITVRVGDVERIDATQEDVRQLLIQRHRTEDFQIRNMASILAAAAETQDTLTILLGSIAAISLLVGGIGVMNIMLVSVSERTREIGVRMATGARRFNIMLQFNTEALAICTFGGVIGILVGLAAVWAFAVSGRPVVVTAGPMILAFVCAFATGFVFGHLPARKAANLDPVAALSSE